MRVLREVWGRARALATTCWRSRLARAVLAIAVLTGAGAFAWRISPEENRGFYVLLALGAIGALVPVAAAAYRLLFIRGPDVRIGFGRGLGQSVEVRPSWPEGKELSQPVPLQVGIANNGDTTAEVISYNLLFPAAVKNAMTTYFMGGISSIKDPPDGCMGYQYRMEGLLPSTYNAQHIEVRFPRQRETYKCECRYVLIVEGQPRQEGSLEIRVVDEAGESTEES